MMNDWYPSELKVALHFMFRISNLSSTQPSFHSLLFLLIDSILSRNHPKSIQELPETFKFLDTATSST